MSTTEDAFRRLTMGDPGLLAAQDALLASALDVQRLDARTDALLRIAALVALDAPESSYRLAVDDARIAGVQLEDLLAALVAVASTVGSAHVISAAPKIAIAASYDVEAALEVSAPAAPPR